MNLWKLPGGFLTNFKCAQCFIGGTTRPFATNANAYFDEIRSLIYVFYFINILLLKYKINLIVLNYNLIQSN